MGALYLLSVACSVVVLAVVLRRRPGPTPPPDAPTPAPAAVTAADDVRLILTAAARLAAKLLDTAA